MCYLIHGCFIVIESTALYATASLYHSYEFKMVFSQDINASITKEICTSQPNVTFY